MINEIELVDGKGCKRYEVCYFFVILWFYLRYGSLDLCFLKIMVDIVLL